MELSFSLSTTQHPNTRLAKAVSAVHTRALLPCMPADTMAGKHLSHKHHIERAKHMEDKPWHRNSWPFR